MFENDPSQSFGFGAAASDHNLASDLGFLTAEGLSRTRKQGNKSSYALGGVSVYKRSILLTA